jgi:leucyl/phenylalanyl-tRNA--protein transferase
MEVQKKAAAVEFHARPVAFKFAAAHMNALDPNIVLYAYTQGVFPMAHPEEGNAVYWHEPHLRGIIPLDGFKVSKNLAREFRSGKYDYCIDRDFEAVLRACAEREETWISDEIMEVYLALHEMGYAHSFEVWKGEELVGGLYGVAMGRAFFGESMFHRVSNASKLALVFLVEYLRQQQFTLLDTQFQTEHLAQFGTIEIPQEAYLKMLAEALA